MTEGHTKAPSSWVTSFLEAAPHPQSVRRRPFRQLDPSSQPCQGAWEPTLLLQLLLAPSHLTS